MKLLSVIVGVGIIVGCLHPLVAFAQDVTPIDSDHDGLSDADEVGIYHTDPANPDTDGDGYNDGDEVYYQFDPNIAAPGDHLDKSIKVSIAEQKLTYYLGTYQIGSFAISTGTKKYPTPKGEYTISKKLPTNLYKGTGYYYPNTRWNMMFKESSKGNYYIHGAYWHNNFGTPMSHGCVNVSYTNMEPLYNWTDIGTKLTIY